MYVFYGGYKMEIVSVKNNDNNFYTLDVLKSYLLLHFDLKHCYYEMLEKIKKQKKYPIVIWGSYYSSLTIYRHFKYVEKINNIEACIVNEEYLSSVFNDVKHEEDFPIYSLEEWIGNHDKTDIIVNFTFFDESLVKNYKNKINMIYLYDIMGTFAYKFPNIITAEDFLGNYNNLKYVYDSLDRISQKEMISYISQKLFGNYDKLYHSNQYFDEDILMLTENETYVDCGAFNGADIVRFCEVVQGKYNKIFAYEMDDNNLKCLYDMIDEKNIYRCIVFEKGVGENVYTTKATKGKGSTSSVGDGIDTVSIVSIDETINEPITFIKMDIEGYELNALKGARKSICKYKPKLAICVYHRFDDLWEIPQFLKSLGVDYKFYIRNYHRSSCECVLYAIA